MGGSGLVNDLRDLLLPIVGEQDHVVTIRGVRINLFALNGTRCDCRVAECCPVNILGCLISRLGVAGGQCRDISVGNGVNRPASGLPRVKQLQFVAQTTCLSSVPPGPNKKIGSYYGGTNRLQEIALQRGCKFIKNIAGRNLPLNTPIAG